MSDELLSEAWLKANGFKWHQFDRQTSKHWLLWLGDVVSDGGGMTCYEDLGIEVTFGSYRGPGNYEGWFCWLRSDAAGRYHRFIHLRTLLTVRDLVVTIQGITGVEFNPENCFGGCLLRPEQAEFRRRDNERLDRVIMRENRRWSDVEKDDTRGRALPEHMVVAEKARTAKA
jgi:hypothetical protein